MTHDPGPAGVIEVFADVCCPFTHVGLRRLVERRDALGRTGVALRVRAWPLELVNGKPLERDLIAHEIDALRTQVSPDLFTRFDPAAFPSSSLPALGLAAAAYRLGDAVGEQVSLALRAALFEEGRDIADPDVLADIAAAVGVPRPLVATDDDVRADWREGQQRGVIGSPHFFAGGQGWFCPALRITNHDGHFEISADPEAFERFVAASPLGA